MTKRFELVLAFQPYGLGGVKGWRWFVHGKAQLGKYAMLGARLLGFELIGRATG